MTVPQPIGAPFEGIDLTWEQDGPVPIIRASQVLRALGMTRAQFDTETQGCDDPAWGYAYFEYDSLYEAMLQVAGSEALRIHMYGF